MAGAISSNAKFFGGYKSHLFAIRLSSVQLETNSNSLANPSKITPWNSMEFRELISMEFHGIPCSSMGLFYTGNR